MAWRWRTAPIADPDLDADLRDGWSNRDDAETWLSDVYADLLAAGLREVTLVDDGRPVYTMSLDEAPGSQTPAPSARPQA